VRSVNPNGRNNNKGEQVRRKAEVAVAGAAIFVAGLSGCSSSNSNTGAAGASNAKVTIDGQDQNIHGTVTCNTVNGKINIAIENQATGIGAVLSDDKPPQVESVGLGNVNGTALGYTAGTSQGNAQATRDGSKYKISGSATGINISDPMHPVTKPFEIDVTCP
jgi:lipoprotein LpqH